MRISTCTSNRSGNLLSNFVHYLYGLMFELIYDCPFAKWCHGNWEGLGDNVKDLTRIDFAKMDYELGLIPKRAKLHMDIEQPATDDTDGDGVIDSINFDKVNPTKYPAEAAVFFYGMMKAIRERRPDLFTMFWYNCRWFPRGPEDREDDIDAARARMNLMQPAFDQCNAFCIAAYDTQPMAVWKYRVATAYTLMRTIDQAKPVFVIYNGYDWARMTEHYDFLEQLGVEEVTFWTGYSRGWVPWHVVVFLGMRWIKNRRSNASVTGS